MIRSAVFVVQAWLVDVNAMRHCAGEGHFSRLNQVCLWLKMKAAFLIRDLSGLALIDTTGRRSGCKRHKNGTRREGPDVDSKCKKKKEKKMKLYDDCSIRIGGMHGPLLTFFNALW